MGKSVAFIHWKKPSKFELIKTKQNQNQGGPKMVHPNTKQPISGMAMLSTRSDNGWDAHRAVMGSKNLHASLSSVASFALFISTLSFVTEALSIARCEGVQHPECMSLGSRSAMGSSKGCSFRRMLSCANGFLATGRETCFLKRIVSWDIIITGKYGNMLARSSMLVRAVPAFHRRGGYKSGDVRGTAVLRAGAGVNKRRDVMR